MEDEQYLLPLKLKLQSLGALRPEAWAMILDLLQATKLKANESFIRKEGTLAYITEGLLKEYDSQNRSKPSIINFISINETLLTRKSNQNHYLKAVNPTIILFWDFEHQKLLYREFEELKKTYDHLCAQYDEGTARRSFLLELPVKDRIPYFKNNFKQIIPYLKKKDIANYLHLDYDYFVRTYKLY